MTDAQIILARHALGLPNKISTSYRNYFCTGTGSSDFADWTEMVEFGHATKCGPFEIFGGDFMFYLTLAGASSALKGREKLCREDFPKAAA